MVDTGLDAMLLFKQEKSTSRAHQAMVESWPGVFKEELLSELPVTCRFGIYAPLSPSPGTARSRVPPRNSQFRNRR
jgi:hypothetical protein